MKNDDFQDLMKSIKQAGEIKRGKMKASRKRSISSQPDVKAKYETRQENRKRNLR